MARIAGVNIPTNKRVEIALTYIHGIGRTTAKKITEQLASRPSAASRTFRPGSPAHPRGDRPGPYGRGRSSSRDGDEHQAADGPRLLPWPSPPQGPPVRGQRTHTNARTRKGKAKPIAGKKK
jgi:small subunit ribosomal protein S13